MARPWMSWGQPGSPLQNQLRPELRRSSLFTFSPAHAVTQVYAYIPWASNPGIATLRMLANHGIIDPLHQ